MIQQVIQGSTKNTSPFGLKPHRLYRKAFDFFYKSFIFFYQNIFGFGRNRSDNERNK
jgi:hypothetical protein